MGALRALWNYVDANRAGAFINAYWKGATKYLEAGFASFFGVERNTGDFIVELAPSGSANANVPTNELLRLNQASGTLHVLRLALQGSGIPLARIIVGQVFIGTQGIALGAELVTSVTMTGLPAMDGSHFVVLMAMPTNGGAANPGANILWGCERATGAGTASFKIWTNNAAGATLADVVWDMWALVFEV